MPSEILTVRAKYIASRGFLSLSKSKSYSLMILITCLAFFILGPFYEHLIEVEFSRATGYKSLFPIKKRSDFIYYYGCWFIFFLGSGLLSYTLMSSLRKETIYLVHFGTNTTYKITKHSGSIDNYIRDRSNLFPLFENNEARIEKNKIFLSSEPKKSFRRHEPIDLFELGFVFHLINCVGLLLGNEERSITFIKNELNLSNIQAQMLFNALFGLGVLVKSSDGESFKPLVLDLSEFITKLENVGLLNGITSVKITHPLQ